MTLKGLGSNPAPSTHATRGRSYKHFMLVNYNSRLVMISKLLILTTLEFTSVEAL